MKYVTRLLEGLWGAFAWLVFGVCCLTSLIVVTFVPSAAARIWFVTMAAKAAFVCSGVRVDVRGLEHLPDDHAVVVANHASYVDGPLLKGFLPARFSFVIKGEMRNVAIAHFLLRRGGQRFVERNVQAASSRDAREIVKAAKEGLSLGFFPEGTFREEPGVGRFRPGAFVAAVRGGMPVVPVAISGSRDMLPMGHFLPRPRRLRIDILEPIQPDDPAFDNPRQLGEMARQRILAVLDEPDLLEDVSG